MKEKMPLSSRLNVGISSGKLYDLQICQYYYRKLRKLYYCPENKATSYVFVVAIKYLFKFLLNNLKNTCLEV